MKHLFFILVVFFSTNLFASSWLEMEFAQLQSLDKITARINTHNISIGAELKIGSLVIKLKSCQTKPPILPPESAAFIQIYDVMSKKNRSNLIFNGWMFASSPALSSLEHPIYDISLISCKNVSTEFQSEISSELTPVN